MSPADGMTPLSPKSGSDIFRNGQSSPQPQGLAASQHELGSLAQSPHPPVQTRPLPSTEAPPSSVLATLPSQQPSPPPSLPRLPLLSRGSLSLCSAPVWGGSGERPACLQRAAPPSLTPWAPQGHLCPDPPALRTPAPGVQAALSVRDSDSALSSRPQDSRSLDLFLSASPALIPKVISKAPLSWPPPATSPSPPCSVSQVPGIGVALLGPQPHRTSPPTSSRGFRNSTPVSPLVHLCSGQDASHTTQPKQNAYFHPKSHFFSFPAA